MHGLQRGYCDTSRPSVTVYVAYVTVFTRAISQNRQVNKFSTHDDPESPWSGTDLGSKRSKVNDTRLEGVRLFVYFYSVTALY